MKQRLARGEVQPGGQFGSDVRPLSGSVGQVFQIGQEDTSVYLCWMGNPAASSRRRILFTTPTIEQSVRVLNVIWEWKIPCPEHTDRRGWRMGGVRDFTKRPGEKAGQSGGQSGGQEAGQEGQP